MMWFDGFAVEKTEFSYAEGSRNGQENWGRLRSKWVACSKGTMQSPIDIIHANAIYDHSLKSLKARYEAAQGKLANSGHGIGIFSSFSLHVIKIIFLDIHRVSMFCLRTTVGMGEGSAGGIHINGTQFVIEEFHWHSPSEHTLDAFVSRYDLEMHMVHSSADGRIVVVAVIYKVGLQDHVLLKEFEKNARPIQPLNQRQVYIFKNES
ncbi:hypothetical protein AMTRI_Chr04g186350 [Amborella trichopoda]